MNLVLMYARWPTPGEVKTRLAVGVGDEVAARCCEAFTHDLVERLRQGAHALVVMASPGEQAAAFASAYDVEAWPQVSGTLGDRLKAGFEQAFARGFSRVAAVGSDTPHLSLERVVRALDGLASADVVLGPCADGGYDVIALKAVEDVFDGIPWSTDAVLRETVRRCAGRVCLLEESFDVDTETDLRRLWEVQEALGPRTRALLETLPK